MVKIIGLISLTISIGLIGIIRFTGLKRRLELLDDFYKLVIEIKSQINYFKEPLPDMFSKLCENNDSKAHFLLNDVRLKMIEKQLQIKEIWPLIANRVYNSEPLTKEDMDLILYLGTFLGQTDYENQLYHFEYLENNLSLQIKYASEEIERRGPLLKKVGFMVGIIISIVLL